jgi:hypothetical protein
LRTGLSPKLCQVLGLLFQGVELLLRHPPIGQHLPDLFFCFLRRHACREFSKFSRKG